jgi:Nucleotidyl transferase AbiEii toxin, Type IV TA system
VSTSQNQEGWRRLFRVVCDLIRQVNSDALVIDHWTFGGATAMMLQVNHRESRDVDIFLRDPQLLPFLDPKTHDFKFMIKPSNYGGDGARVLKLYFDEIGEIDFIVDDAKTANPTIQREIEGQNTILERVPEIITKKIVHRGASLKPRDIFDIAASAEHYADDVISGLRSYRKEVARALETMESLNPEFANNVISQLVIRPEFSEVAKTAIDRAKRLLRAI